MIIDYDHNQNLNTDRKLDSLKESVQMALNEVQTSLINLMVKPKAKEIIGLMDFFYPIGSYYETSDASFDPNVAWGGVWTKLGEGVVLMSGGGSNYNVGTTYGGNTKNYTPSGSVSVSVATHKLTTTEIPKHTHGQKTLTAYFSGRRCGSDSVSHWGGTNTSITASSTAVTTSTAVGTSNKHQDIVNINMTHTHDNVGGDGAHGHPNSTGSFTGTQATINVMQNSLATCIWHRTA